MSMLLLCLFLILNRCIEAALTDRPNLSAGDPAGPFRHFKTEPTFEALLVNITKYPDDSSLLSPGYYFLTPFRYKPNDNWGPQIVDQDGHVVWYGQETVPISPRTPNVHLRAQDFKVCDYLGAAGQHLCWNEAQGEHTKNRVLDSSYSYVGEPYAELGGWGLANPHEFNMLPGGRTFLRPVYLHKAMDMRPYKGPQDGIVADGCFQEINVETREVEFSWCFLDHYSVDETRTYLNVPENTVNFSMPSSGKGLDNSPWDFVHINSADKNEEGDYIISCRHTDQLIKIAGKSNVMGMKPGDIVWRLGGDNGDFEIAEDALFSRQHSTRFVSTGPEETVVSVFDNAWDGFNEASAQASSAMMLIINNVTMKTTLKQMYPHPYGKLSPAQGSAQLLPNGNVAVGWGSLSEYSEYSGDGTLLFHAGFSTNPLISYRTVKHIWEGNPQQPPKILAYSQTCQMTADRDQSPLVVYASWNGATKIAAWRFSVSFESAQGPWRKVGIFDKTGFETMAYLSTESIVNTITFAPYVLGEALDSKGSVLSQAPTSTFVPMPQYSAQCNAVECFQPQYFSYDADFNFANKCKTEVYSHTYSYATILFVFFAAVEIANWLLLVLCDLTTNGDAEEMTMGSEMMFDDSLRAALAKEKLR